MANAADFHNLSKEIENAYKDRTKWIKAMYRDGKREKKDRIADNKHRHEDIIAFKTTVDKFVSDLTKGSKARAKANRDLKNDVARMLEGFRSECKEAADKMIADLTAETKARAADVAKMLADLTKGSKARAVDISKMLEGFRNERKKAADKMIADLTADTKAREADVAKMLTDFKGEDKARAKANRDLKNDVARMLEGFRSERVEAARVWHNLLKTMSAARMSKPKPTPKAKPTPSEAVPAPPEEAAPAPLPEVKPAPKPKPEKPKFKDPALETTKEGKVLAVLYNNPKGLSLTDIGKELGVHFVTLSAPIKTLENEGKVAKRDNLYFLTR